jgi:hypothetical protein
MRGFVCVPPGHVSLTGLPEFSSAVRNWSAVALGQAERIAAKAPATCGAAGGGGNDLPAPRLRFNATRANGAKQV